MLLAKSRLRFAQPLLHFVKVRRSLCRQTRARHPLTTPTGRTARRAARRIARARPTTADAPRTTSVSATWRVARTTATRRLTPTASSRARRTVASVRCRRVRFEMPPLTFVNMALWPFWGGGLFPYMNVVSHAFADKSHIRASTHTANLVVPCYLCSPDQGSGGRYGYYVFCHCTSYAHSIHHPVYALRFAYPA